LLLLLVGSLDCASTPRVRPVVALCLPAMAIGVARPWPSGRSGVRALWTPTFFGSVVCKWCLLPQSPAATAVCILHSGCSLRQGCTLVQGALTHLGAPVVAMRDACGDALAVRHTKSSVVATIVVDRGGSAATPLLGVFRLPAWCPFAEALPWRCWKCATKVPRLHY
jgi:hypothetical protein